MNNILEFDVVVKELAQEAKIYALLCKDNWTLEDAILYQSTSQEIIAKAKKSYDAYFQEQLETAYNQERNYV